ncbi:hypothetical protein ACFS7Z_04075 [Pontibacter toksunensis]|uniref:Uncharacterized protein n=1 Tax=Pontibacter toksunensis TaxID=1332631 RepID=A0ABW6BQW7_9BACT
MPARSECVSSLSVERLVDVPVLSLLSSTSSARAGSATQRDAGRRGLSAWRAQAKAMEKVAYDLLDKQLLQ